MELYIVVNQQDITIWPSLEKAKENILWETQCIQQMHKYGYPTGNAVYWPTLTERLEGAKKFNQRIKVWSIDGYDHTELTGDLDFPYYLDEYQAREEAQEAVEKGLIEDPYICTRYANINSVEVKLPEMKTYNTGNDYARMEASFGLYD